MNMADDLALKMANGLPFRDVLRLHAHMLAEKIRNSESLRDLTDDHMNDCNAAADEIDEEI